MIDEIVYKGKKYKIREIEFEGELEYVGSQSLQEVLFDADGEYVSDEAKNIDEQFIFFIEDEQMNCSDDELIAILEENIG